MTQQELDALMLEVESDVLRKSEPAMKADEADMEEAAAEEEAPAEEAPLEEMPAEEAPSEEAAPAEEMPEEAPAEEAALEGDPEQGAESEESLEAVLDQMSDEELQALHEALMARLQHRWSAEAEQAPMEAAAEAPAEEAVPMIAKEEKDPNGQLMAKSVGADRLAKAESALQEKDKEIEQLKKGLAELAEVLQKKMPVRKDITDIQVIRKSEADAFEGETLEKSEKEVFSDAIALAKSESTSWQEREVLNAYFTDRSKSGPVRELLKSKKK